MFLNDFKEYCERLLTSLSMASLCTFVNKSKLIIFRIKVRKAVTSPIPPLQQGLCRKLSQKAIPLSDCYEANHSSMRAITHSLVKPCNLPRQHFFARISQCGGLKLKRYPPRYRKKSSGETLSNVTTLNAIAFLSESPSINPVAKLENDLPANEHVGETPSGNHLRHC